MPAAHMSSRLEDTSAILGEYMLKGWTLTDLQCDQCRVTPLMREPAGSASAENRDRIQFCALCDGSPAGRGPAPAPAPGPAPAASSSSALTTTSQSAAQAVPDPSESISTLLLQGYSLLGDNCPNASCRGIPLVGFPKKKDGTKDGRRMCVSCGGRWVDGNDLAGMTLVPPHQHGVGSESPRSKASREMYGLSAGSETQSESKGKGKEIESAIAAPDSQLDEPEQEAAVFHTAKSQRITLPVRPSTTSNDSPPDPVLVSALSKTSASLARTLDRIATSLDKHTERDQEEGRYFVDVKLHTEAIKDVMSVMGMVRRFRP